MTAADALAILRALAAIPIVWAIAVDDTPVAFVLFALAALSDAIDGPLARRTGTTGPRGALLDPLADKILVVGTVIALAIAGRGWPVTVVAVLVTAREAVVAFLRVRAFRRGTALPTDGLAKAKTAAEMVALALIITDGRPWAVLGAGLMGLAFLLGLATLPRYLPGRLRRAA